MELGETPLPKVIDEAAALLGKFVVPLYETDNRGRPSSYGSGFFVKAGSHHFLVSAAHVLETLEHRPLFYYIAPGTIRHVLEKPLVSPWSGDRENDPTDVGIVRLNGNGCPPYPAVEKFAIDASYLRPAYLPRSGKNYLILGFPISRSRVGYVRSEVAVTLHGYRSNSIDDAKYSGPGLSPETHVILPLDLKVGFDSNGKHRNFPKPQGMSGSPIWVLYDEGERNELDVFQIVGIGTKYRKRERLILGTDIASVLDMINSCLVSG